VSVEEHRSAGGELGAIPVALITVSDTRTPETDANGIYLQAELELAGHAVAFYEIVPDEPERVLGALDQALKLGARVILVNGGTGISGRDRTFEALSQKIERPLPGFGELFRMLSYEQIGSAAMLSRACGGVVGKSVIFSMPGSSKAVTLAWETLIAPEIGHLIHELDRAT
jgi:molybdopterin adenylyltransferase